VKGRSHITLIHTHLRVCAPLRQAQEGAHLLLHTRCCKVACYMVQQGQQPCILRVRVEAGGGGGVVWLCMCSWWWGEGIATQQSTIMPACHNSTQHTSHPVSHGQEQHARALQSDTALLSGPLHCLQGY
jgi:hypothetical protein